MVFTEKKLTIDGLEVCYRVAGDPKNEPLVFLHGWGARRSNIRGPGKNPILRAFAKRFYVIAPEHPGFIHSQPPKKVMSFEDSANHQDKLLTKIKIKKFHLVGHSFGGGIATTYASMFPHKLKTLVLIGAVLGGRKKNMHTRLDLAFNQFFSWFVNSAMPLYFKKVFTSAYLGVPFSRSNKNNISDYGIMGDIKMSDTFNVDFSKLKMKVVLVWGEKDTYGRTDISKARAMHAQLKNSSLITVSGGHLLLRHHPEHLIQKITKHI